MLKNRKITISLVLRFAPSHGLNSDIISKKCETSELQQNFLFIFCKLKKQFIVTQCCIDANSVVREIAKNYLTSLDLTKLVNFQEFRKSDAFIVLSVENYLNVIKIVS